MDVTTYDTMAPNMAPVADLTAAVEPAAPAAASPAIGQGEPSATQPASKSDHRRGPPAGNSNATKSGLRGSKLPKGCVREEGHIHNLIRRVRAEYEARHGGPMTAHADAILHRLRRAATRDRLSARWLRIEHDNLTIEQRMALVDASSAAADTIEKCLRQLGLDEAAAEADPWAVLDNRQPLPPPRPQEKPPCFSAASEPQQSPEAAGTPPRPA
jgi:hypothetical protein